MKIARKRSLKRYFKGMIFQNFLPPGEGETPSLTPLEPRPYGYDHFFADFLRWKNYENC